MVLYRRLNELLKTSQRVNAIAKRTSFYNKYKHGPHAANNKGIDLKEAMKELFSPKGKEFFISEAKRIWTRLKNPPASAENDPDKTYVFEHFDSDESLAKWRPLADSDTNNGYSVANLSRSPSGHALFSGILDNRIPDDGVTMNSGFVSMAGPYAPRKKIIEIETFWNWSHYNTLEVKFRGDGRKYAIVVNTAQHYNDLAYYDAHFHVLHTRGGPYWQTVRIPFSKFIFIYKGLIQDDIRPLPADRIKFVSIVLHDRVDGPFRLEVDYMGLRAEHTPFLEISPYETYVIPHIRYRPLQVDCEPPQLNQS